MAAWPVDAEEQAKTDARVESRRLAEYWLAEIAKEGLNSPDPAAFTQRVIELVAEKNQKAAAPEDVPMTVAESKSFGSQVCRYRAHEGERWDDISLEYIETIADLSLKTYRDLTRYLRSARLRREQEC